MKKYICFAAIIAAILCTVSCQKENPIVTGTMVNQAETVVYPTSDTPIELVVTVSMTYDMKLGEYVFTADKVFPCDIKFKAYQKYSGIGYFALKKGTRTISYPFNRGDENAPKDFYEIVSVKHWKCNNEEKNEFVHGNITYRFYYNLSGQNAEDNDNESVKDD